MSIFSTANYVAQENKIPAIGHPNVYLLVRFTVCYYCPPRAHLLWGPPNFWTMGTMACFTEAWSWPLISTWHRR